MNVIELNSLARKLREVALTASQHEDDTKLSMAQLMVFETVARTPRVSVKEITEQTGLAQSWVSKIVAGQCEDGVFVLSQDPGDRRRTIVSLSDQAQKATFRDRGVVDIDEALTATFPHLSPEAVTQVKVLLTQLQHVLQDDEKHP